MTLLQDLLEVLITNQRAHSPADALAHIRKHAHLFTTEGVSEVVIGDKLYVGWVLNGKLCYLLETSKSQLNVLGYSDIYQVNLASSDRDARAPGMRIAELYERVAKRHPLLSAAYETEAGGRAWKSFKHVMLVVRLSDAVKHRVSLTSESMQAIGGDIRAVSKRHPLDTYVVSPEAALAYKIPTARLMLYKIRP